MLLHLARSPHQSGTPSEVGASAAVDASLASVVGILFPGPGGTGVGRLKLSHRYPPSRNEGEREQFCGTIRWIHTTIISVSAIFNAGS